MHWAEKMWDAYFSICCVIGCLVTLLIAIAVPLFVLYALIHTITGWTLW